MPQSDVERIREEITTALEEEGGWNKPALARLWLLDSLLREIGRAYGLGLGEHFSCLLGFVFSNLQIQWSRAVCPLKKGFFLMGLLFRLDGPSVSSAVQLTRIHWSFRIPTPSILSGLPS